MGKYNAPLQLEENNSLSLLLKRISPHSTVLEFGPAHGRMSQYLKEKLTCNVYAVEIDTTAAEDAQAFCEKIVVGSIETYEWEASFKGITFDYIIFADVLEHLYYPKKALMAAKKFLKKDGAILVSVPNVAHNAIVMELLHNRFTYRPIGLLDDTHIRFFTKTSFDALAQECGLVRSYESGVSAKPDMTEFGYNYNEFPIGAYLQDREFGEVYQLIYEFKLHSVGEVQSEYLPQRVGSAQLFVDTGNGFCEAESICIDNPHTLTRLTFNVEPFSTIKALRFDPFDKKCIVEILKVTLESQNGDILEIPFTPRNALFQENGRDYFTHHDPCYVKMCDESIQKAKCLHVELHYAYIDEKAVQHEVESVLLMKIATLSGELDCIKNSRSWKITQPLRKLRRFV